MLPPLFTSIITPPSTHNTMIFNAKPSTEYEAQLQEALCVVIRTGNPRVLLGNPYPTRAKPLPALTGMGFGGFG